jgi:hypothetical protein
MLTEISEEAYNKIDPIFRVIVHDHPRKFALIHPPKSSNPLALCWRGELIQPLVAPERQGSGIWLGVDQRLVCLSPEGSTLFSIGLDSFLVRILHFDHCTVALCEIEAIVVNQDYSLRAIPNWPEIAQTAVVKRDQLVVTSIDGSVESFSI